MNFFFLLLSIFTALFFEVTFVQLPLVLIVLILYAVIFQDLWIFPVALVTGMILDSLLFRLLGSSSMFFLCILFLVFLYKQKYEIKTVVFVGIITTISSTIYMLIFGYSILALQILASIFLSIVLFLGYTKYFSIWTERT